MRKNWIVGMGIGVLAGGVLVGTIYGLNGFKGFNNKVVEVNGKDIVFDKGKIAYIDKAIRSYYINDLNSEDMIEGIFEGYVYGLEDPYTVYLTAEEFNKEKEEAVGNYIGMGIKYAWGITSQYIIVTDVIEGSPAEQAGIQVGDKIIEIDGIPAMASNEVKIYDKLVYSGKNPVKYRITDNGGSNEREVVLTAKLVEVDLVHSEHLENGVGYVVLDGLVDGTVEEVKQQLDNLVKEGVSKVVLDLRDTHSLNLDEVIKLCDLFLDEQEIFVVENYKDEVVSYKSEKGKYDMELVVLTNHYTQGALEAFVATMKETDRAVIVGEKTKGDGTTQEKIALEDGSGLMITTGIIKTMNGQVIYGEGVEPDIVQKETMQGNMELITTGKLQKQNDAVLQKALKSFK